MDQTSSAAPTPVLAPVPVPSLVFAPVTTPTRLRREIKPNKKYDPDVYDLSKTDARIMDAVGSSTQEGKGGHIKIEQVVVVFPIWFRTRNETVHTNSSSCT